MECYKTCIKFVGETFTVSTESRSKKVRRGAFTFIMAGVYDQERGNGRYGRVVQAEYE